MSSAIRTVAALLVATAAGCGLSSPPTAKPTALQPKSPEPASATGTVAAKSPISAEVVSAEIRRVKTTHLLSGGAEGPVCLIVRVRFTNADDTIDTRGVVFDASPAVDEFGNRLPHRAAMVTTMQKIAEPEDLTDLTPGSPSVSSFVFDAPIPKATTVTFTAVVTLNRSREPRIEFPFTVALPAR